MTGGVRHEHVSQLWWVKCIDGRETTESGSSSRDQMVSFIEKNGNASVWCPDRDPKRQGAWVHVNHNGSTKYVQTVADGRWTDNLLALPDR
nr:DUF3892 domain-containing protein [Burkholderia ubonensis]